MGDPTSRALKLLGLLENRPVWSGDELARRLGVTPRTVRRDIDRLRALGYTVAAEPGAGGGYSLGRGQVLPPLLLDEDETVAVTLALIGAALEGAGPHAEAAVRALTKIEDVTPASVRSRVTTLRQAVTVAPERDRVGAGVLMPVADAVRRGVRLTFAYVDRHGAATSRTVEPHRLLARRRSWRLVAYDLDRADWRTFRLDRLREPAVGTWRFSPRPGVDAVVARLAEPAPPDAWAHQVTVLIHAPLDQVAATLPALAGRLRARGDTTTEFTAGANDPADAARWLAHLGHDFTIVEGAAVREAVRDLGHRLTLAAAAVPDPPHARHRA